MFAKVKENCHAESIFFELNTVLEWNGIPPDDIEVGRAQLTVFNLLVQSSIKL